MPTILPQFLRLTASRRAVLSVSLFAVIAVTNALCANALRAQGTGAPPTGGAAGAGSARAGQQKGASSTTKRSPRKATHAPHDSGSVRRDTVKRAPGGMLGPSSGERHMAYRGMGSDLDSLWPPKMPDPLPGSIFPTKRIVAFYGNPKSNRMGILGEFPPAEMLRKLDDEVAEWQKLDPSHPVVPAMHVIAVVAQGDPGRDGKYRLRHDSSTIEQVYGWARQKNGVMFVDVQVGWSTLQQELPWLERFLIRPDVHLGIDPEFSMKDGVTRPGKKIGTYDAADVNYAIRFLAGLVEKYKLPPKILVVHRFTHKGLTNYKDIKLDPRVQVVIDMDGFGAPWLKRDSYYAYVKKEPVEFTGWKQFSKTRNDNPPTKRADILRLWPVPLYIQVQ